MIKQAPSLRRIASIVLFALVTYGVGLYLWEKLGGSVPLQPHGYRLSFEAGSPRNVVENIDVRIAGINVGKVTEVEPGRQGTRVEVEMDEQYAPVAADTHATVRTKTIGGEAYIELSPGSPDAPRLPEGGSLRRRAVEEPVQIDDFLEIFDPPTRRAFRAFSADLAKQLRSGADISLNNALGHLAPFSEEGNELLGTLAANEQALGLLVRNTGVVFEALNERRGQLRELVVNAERFFSATASRDEALAEVIRIFPTFLDESKRTFQRLGSFSQDAEQLARDLKPVSRELLPFVHELKAISPPLGRYFRHQAPLRRATETGGPASARLLEGAGPLFEALHPFLEELNPIISYLNYSSPFIVSVLQAGAQFAASISSSDGGRLHYQRAFSSINDRSVLLQPGRPEWDRGHAYPSPDAFERATRLGILESPDCAPTGGERREAEDRSPPCFVAPPNSYDGNQFPRLKSGVAPLCRTPGGPAGPRRPGR